MTEKTYYSSSTDTSINVRSGKLDLLNTIFEKLKLRGFTVQTDQHILKEYPTLSSTHWEGKKGDLLFKSEIYPSGFKFEFYQEINTVNSSGGQYDFNKYELMPYLVRCQYILTRKYICELLDEYGYTNKAEPPSKNALDKVMKKIKGSSHYEKGKELPEFELESYNATDKDGNQLYNGQVKYFRDRKGRLMRGTIYHNINNMWWVIINKFEYTNKACFEFFDFKVEHLSKRRIQNKVMPQRIRIDKLREKFKTLNFDYSLLNEEHIQMLRIFIAKELDAFDSDMDLSLSTQKKKDIKVLKRTGLQFANIKVDANYFREREAITFNSDGFIGFAGWACNYNVTPYANAFDKWMDWLTELIEIGA